MRIKIPKQMSNFLADIFIYKYPPFFGYKFKQHDLTGKEKRQIIKTVKKGDILLRRFNHYLASMFIPGYWSHVGIYMEDDTVIHAIGSGVTQEDILDFMKTDCISICRTKNTTSSDIDRACNMGVTMVSQHVEYDYSFEDNNGKVYCSELANVVYCNLFQSDYIMSGGNHILLPQGVFDSKEVQEILTFKH